MGFFDVSKVLKATKKMILYVDRFDRQWVGDYNAMYLLYDMPGTVEPADLFELMGTDKDKRRDYVASMLPLPYHPDSRASLNIFEFGIPFVWDGLLYQVFCRDGQYYPVLDIYIKALKCFKGERDWMLREHEGRVYIEMWHGGVCIAIISPELICGNNQFAHLFAAQAASFAKEYERFDRTVAEPSLFENNDDSQSESDMTPHPSADAPTFSSKGKAEEVE